MTRWPSALSWLMIASETAEETAMGSSPRVWMRGAKTACRAEAPKSIRSIASCAVTMMILVPPGRPIA
jgi:hypothetical protein